MLNKVKSAFGGKKILAGLGILSLILGVAIPVFAQTPEATVTATVTVKKISVTVSPTSIAYGVLATGVESTASAEITATNDGNVTENFGIKGANTTAWTLGPTAGSETYVHKFSTDASYAT